MSKAADAIVVIGKTRGGQSIYRTVGALFSGDNSTKGPAYFLRLDKSFNPAGALSSSPDDPSITVNFYYPSEKDTSRKVTPAAAKPAGFDDLDDDIPF